MPFKNWLWVVIKNKIQLQWFYQLIQKIEKEEKVDDKKSTKYLTIPYTWGILQKIDKICNRAFKVRVFVFLIQ